MESRKGNVHWETRDRLSAQTEERFLKAGDPDFSLVLEKLKADPECNASVMTNCGPAFALSRLHK